MSEGDTEAEPGADGGKGDAAKQEAMRPRDSSTLIIVDTTAGEPRVLMGKRRMDVVFLPGKYVFPGGRVDAVDRGVESADELDPVCAAKLLVEMKPTPSAARARAIALAAIRETWEEAGLLIGAAGAPSTPVKSDTWTTFHAAGFLPKLSPLTFFARAITPPGRPRRYDSRFFYADVSAITHRSDINDGELSSLDWFTFEEVRALDLPAITRVVLEDLIDRLELDRKGKAAAAAAPIPFYSHRNGTSRRQLLAV